MDMNQDIQSEGEKEHKKNPLHALKQLPSDSLSIDQLRAFFTHQIVAKQLLFTPKIDIDNSGDFSKQDNIPGFIFITGINNPELLTGANDNWIKGKTDRYISFGDTSIAAVSDYGNFPQDRFDHELISEHHRPNTFKALKAYFNVTKEYMSKITVQSPNKLLSDEYFHNRRDHTNQDD